MKSFLKIILNLKLYLVEFNSEKNRKNKIYFDNCQVKNKNSQSIIVIKYNKYIFSTNDRKTYR